MYRNALTGLAMLGLTAYSPLALAETDQQEALEAGASQLSADEIANMIVGKTVKARAGEKMFLFYYGDDNVLSGKMIGGDWSDVGYYGITDDNRVCLSMSKDKGRLRCLTLLRAGETVKKFNIDGKLAFEFMQVRDGNQL